MKSELWIYTKQKVLKLGNIDNYYKFINWWDIKIIEITYNQVSNSLIFEFSTYYFTFFLLKKLYLQYEYAKKNLP